MWYKNKEQRQLVSMVCKVYGSVSNSKPTAIAAYQALLLLSILTRCSFKQIRIDLFGDMLIY